MKLSKTLFALTAAIAVVTTVRAASVGPAGYTNDFSTQPVAADWSTATFAGAAGDATTAVQVDTNVATLVATAITGQLNASNASPPNAFATAVWCTSGYVQTRPTGVRLTILMATLVNNSGTNANALHVNYNYVTNRANLVAEEVRGQRVYYSQTGAANSWTLIPALTQTAAGTLSAEVVLGSVWNNGSTLYLLWADDNGSGSPDDANDIGNFFASAYVANVAVTVSLVAPTNGATFAQGANVTLSATNTGTVTNMGFYVDNALVNNATTVPYSYNLASCALSVGAHTVYAVGTANGVQTFSGTNTFHLTANQAPTVSVTNVGSATVLVGTAITNFATVADDTSVASVTFYLDGVSNYTRTVTPWEYVYNDSVFGTHTIYAIATDNCGLQTTSTSISVTVTNPTPDYHISLANGSIWKYWATATAPPDDGNGSSWYQGGYDDSTWSTGRAELGFGDNSTTATDAMWPEVTLLPKGSPQYISYYFRNTFSVADHTQVSNVVVRLLRDDGAVVYLNGQPIWTNNFAAAQMANPITNATLAANATDDGTVYQVLNVSPDVLQDGVNHVAVEVHQSSATSSDVSFDLMLWAQTYTPPSVAITSPTANQTFAGGCSGLANVTVTAAASFFVYNVSFNLDGGGTLVATNVTSPFSVTFQNVTFGSHTVVATAMDTANNVVDSAPITFIVTPNQAPTIAITNTFSSGVTGLVYLVGTCVTNQLSVTDDGSVTNVDWYLNGQLRVRIPAANNWSTILVNDLLAGTNVLQAVAWDNCGTTNTSAPVHVIGTNPPAVSVIVPNGSVWKYFGTNSAPPTNSSLVWLQPGYDDSTWLSGAGELGGGDANHNADANNPETTLIDIGATTRYSAVYFRHAFNVANPSQYTNLLVRLLRDDGGVVYLNGNPVLTNNMNAGPFTYATLATAAIGDDGTVYVIGNVNPTNLVTGANTLAVEVHQDNTTSSDLSFDLMLWGEGSITPPPMSISLTGGNVQITWIGSGFKLQHKNDLSPSVSWQDVAGNPQNTYSVAPTGLMFYRLIPE